MHLFLEKSLFPKSPSPLGEGDFEFIFNSQVPLAQQPNLLRRVALGDHAGDEVLMLLGFVGAGLGESSRCRHLIW